VADASARGRGPAVFVVVVAAAVILVDQITKTLALHHLSTVIDGARVYQPHHLVGPLYLELTFNRGAAFGLGAGATPIVESGVVILIVGLLVFGRRAAMRSGWAEAVGLGLLVGGALGNLSDRLFRHHDGGVIDFINIAQVGNHEYWPVFNVADSAIVIGALSVALLYSRRSSRRPKGLPSAVVAPEFDLAGAEPPPGPDPDGHGPR
jgi:signal peptidase II